MDVKFFFLATLLKIKKNKKYSIIFLFYLLLVFQNIIHFFELQ